MTTSKKTLFDFYEELSSLGFDKKKTKGLVKRANTAGLDIYYAYHEDGQDTWKCGWSSNDYKNDESDVKLFEATDLIGKKKPSRSFQRAQTYTAECAIFVFAPLKTILEDSELRDLQIISVKKKAEKYAIADYNRAIEVRNAFDKWQKLPEENKSEINKLATEISENMGQPGSRKIRAEKEKRINELGGWPQPLAKWQIEAAALETVEKYIKYRQDKAVAELLKEAYE